MFVGLARFGFVVHASMSLKDKRRVVRRLTDGMRAKFNVAVAEVDHMDLWQRATLGVTCVSNSSFHVRQMLSEIERFIRNHPELEVVEVEIQVVSPQDA